MTKNLKKNREDNPDHSIDSEFGSINPKNFEYSHEKKSIERSKPLKINQNAIGKERITSRKENNVQEISKSDLRDLIEKNKDIDEITIENLKFNEGNRYRINFEKRFDHNNQSKLKNLETRINANFLEINLAQIENKKSFDGGLKLLESGSGLEQAENKNSFLIEYEKHSLKRKVINIKVEELYYQISNHKDLFNLGKSYLKDLSEGNKCFGLGHVSDKQRSADTVLGLGAYFRYHTNLKVCALVDMEKHRAMLEKSLGLVSIEAAKGYSEELKMEIISTSLMDLVDINSMESASTDLRDLVKKLYNSYDVVFVELPEILFMDQRRNLFFPLVNILDNVSLILRFKNSTYSSIEKGIEFYKKYDVKVKGVLLS